MAKVKKEKIKIGKKEKIFNIISVVVLSILAIYFGSRAVYYAIEEHEARQNYDKSIAQGVINSNSLVTSGNGLYKDTDGYFFKGEIDNNYVSFNNILFRIVGITNDKELILVSDANVSTFMWGNDLSYTESNVYNWLNITEKENSGVFENLLPISDEYLIKQDIIVQKFSNSEFTDTDIVTEKNISLLSAEDYIKAGGEGSFLDNDTFHWLLGVDDDGNYLYVDDKGNISSDKSYGSYGVRPVIKLDKDVILLRGKGEEDNPYIIQIEEESYINTYVELGEDLFRVFEESDTTIKMAKTENLTDTRSFGDTNTKYDINSRDNIGYYLNNDYYNSLPYKDKLVDCSFSTGLINDDNNNDFTSIYSEETIAKIGIPNVFDFINTENSDFFYLTYNGHVSDVAFVKNELGLLNKVQISESKNVVPVICINKESITSGVGAEYSPYVVE